MNKLTTLILTASLLLAVGAAGCTAPTSAQPSAPAATPAALSTPMGTLSAAEAEGLVFMREEEKLARDVYRALYDQWHLPIFQNIAESEQSHMTGVKTLLDRYGIADPAANAGAGIFANATLQGLYDQLVQQGSQSPAEALRVGALIEEIDIADLQKHIAATDAADIAQVYDNLMRGSRNHLRSFTAQLETQTGAPYTPQHLTQTEYDAIIGSDIETGRGRRSSGQGVGRRGGR